MNRLLYATALASGLVLGTPAVADLPVVDVSQLLKWAQQAQQMQQQIVQLEMTVHSLTNIPNNLTSMVQNLLHVGVQNPLGQIVQNLQVMLSGRGTGTCTGAQTYLTQNQYAPAVGTDFMGQIMNQSANRNAGLQACTQQMLAATETRLQQMPALLDELQGATDVTQATAISGRIQYEIATINAQQQQAIAMSAAAELQDRMAQDQILQKQRADANEVFKGTSPGAAPGNIPTVTQPPNLFAGGG